MTVEAPYLDVADPTFSIRSTAIREARENGWYARTPYGIAVLRYEEASQLVRHPKLIQGSRAWPDHAGVTGPWADWWKRIMLNVEGEDHTRLRRLMNPAFSPRLIKSLVPQFQELANELIDAFYDRGRCEFMSEFSEPYATRVIAKLLGIPESEWRTLATWSEHLGLGLAVNAAEYVDLMNAALDGYYGYADALIADRRADPRDDFVTSLVEARDAGDRLTDQELRDHIVLLIFGGIDTTRNQLGLAVDMFIRHPDQWRLLAERPELAPQAVEEVMRTRPTTTWVTREAAEDFTYRDLDLTRGTTVHLIAESIGTDPRAGGGEAFDIAAENRPRHMGFGGGRHHCIGHFIARGDMGEALILLARRLKGIRYDGEPTFLPDSGNTGPIESPVAFDR